jgi:hypothetical protein
MAEEVINRIIRLQEDIRGTDEDILRERIYVCVANSCILLNSYINSNGQKGWSTRLINDDGQPILSQGEQDIVESILDKAPWVLDFFKAQRNPQKGGATKAVPNAPDVNAPDVNAPDVNDPVINAPDVSAVPNLSDDEVSLNATFNSVIETTEKWDNYWKKMESDPKAFGPIKKILNTNPITTPLPPPFTVIPVSLRLVTRLLVTVLDLIRLGMARSGRTSVPLTLIIFLEELVTGQWRLMLLTAASLFITPSGVASTIMIKYLVMAWLTFGTDEQKTRLIKNVFKGSKSTIVNLIIYAYVLLTPTAIKATMFGMPGDEVTYDVIQAKLLLLDSKQLICSPAAMDLVKELKSDPFLGLASELLNIPAVDKLEKVCGDKRAVSMTSFSEAEELDDIDALDTATPPPLPPRPSLAIPQSFEQAEQGASALTNIVEDAKTKAMTSVSDTTQQLKDQALAGATDLEKFKTANPLLTKAGTLAGSLIQTGGRKTKKMNKKPVKKSRKHGHRRH